VVGIGQTDRVPFIEAGVAGMALMAATTAVLADKQFVADDRTAA
jgi:hypothetical protein